MTAAASRSIVIVDDDEDIVSLLEALISTRDDYRLSGVFVDVGAASASAVASARPDALVVGAQRCTFDPIELIRALRAELPDACIVLLADVADPLTLLDALAGGASTVLSSGWGWAELMPSLDLLLDRRAA